MPVIIWAKLYSKCDSVMVVSTDGTNSMKSQIHSNNT